MACAQIDADQGERSAELRSQSERESPVDAVRRRVTVQFSAARPERPPEILRWFSRALIRRLEGGTRTQGKIGRMQGRSADDKVYRCLIISIRMLALPRYLPQAALAGTCDVCSGSCNDHR